MGLWAVVGFLLEEFLLRDSREGRGLVDDGCIVDLLGDRDGVVDVSRLDSLALDDRLDCTVSAK